MSIPRSYTSNPASSGGIASITVSTDGPQTWDVSQVSIEMATAPIGSTCKLLYNGSFVSALIPTGDAATGPPDVTVRPGDTLVVQWQGVTPGMIGKAFILYDVVQ